MSMSRPPSENMTLRTPDCFDVDASSQSTISPVEAKAENELIDLPSTATKKGISQNVLEDEVIIANRDYPCKIIGEQQIRGHTWYLIEWEATLEPQENVSSAAVKAWQEENNERGDQMRVHQVQSRKNRKQQ